MTSLTTDRPSGHLHRTDPDAPAQAAGADALVKFQAPEVVFGPGAPGRENR